MKTMAANAAAATSIPADSRTPVHTLDFVRCRAALESRWRQKLDELIVLSRACADVAADTDEFAHLGAMPYRRLRRRTDRTYDDLAAIEAAIARVEGGTYGNCARCGSLMAADWLADQPDVRLCRSCTSPLPRR